MGKGGGGTWVGSSHWGWGMAGITGQLGEPSTLESSRWATKVARALHTFHCFSEHRSSETTWMPT